MEVGQREFSLRGGRIILHTRADDKQSVWQCRLRLGTERKLVRRSTKTTDLVEAKATAEELYEELKAALVTMKRLLAFCGFDALSTARESGRYLFEHDNGDVRRTFEVGFKALLRRADLKLDRYGGKRTLYCLRHSYATFRLLYGATDVYLLARNMGTSVAMIEQHYGHVTTTLSAERLV